jgi:hypothetical protein
MLAGLVRHRYITVNNRERPLSARTTTSMEGPMSSGRLEKYSQFVDIIVAPDVVTVEKNSDDDSYGFSHKPPH